MRYRVLVDQNTSPWVAGSLRGTGITADHVHEALSEGVDDDTIAAFARESGSVVLTHDPDFLDPETHSGVAELIEWVPDPADLPLLTNLNEWE